jgi:uncharacterized protein
MNEITGEHSKELCAGCTECCTYISTLINPPKNKKDIDRILWFLLHKGTTVYSTQDLEEWRLEVITGCTALNTQGECDIYQDRPSVCREHNQDDCERYSPIETYYAQMFHTRQEFLDYVNKTPKLIKINTS